MIVGVPKEIKTREYRVGLVPGGAAALKQRGHTVLVEKNAGVGSGIPDELYIAAGCEIVGSADEVWKRADMIMKVKEPIAPEFPRMREGQVVYTYFHLAAAPELGKVLLDKKVASVAYETVETPDHQLPLLKPMSEVAGRMSVQVGAVQLEKEHGGKGILLSGVPGVRRGKIVILGGGVVGTNAAKMAVGMGAEVTILDVNINRLAYLDDIFGSSISTVYSDPAQIERYVRQADLVIGGVLVPGAKAPRLVSEKLISEMQPGSVVVDVAVDQGGCIETCHPTTHENPTYEVHGVIHYCVANMPGAVPYTSTFALNNATIGYGLKLADLGLKEAIKRDHALALGVNTLNGVCTYQAVAEALSFEYVPLEKALTLK
ncbi:MAG: alanine dehydrogenase [Deltaproteobacteria bacterium]|nr:alanine dehydrogenase [Deltaproteobacteria bacterium]